MKCSFCPPNIRAKPAAHFCFVTCSMVLLFWPTRMWAQELPAGTTLEVRLSNVSGSHSSRRGDPIEASVIAPVSVRGRILVPQGSTLRGFVANADAIGLGLKHVTAAISYAFDTLQLPSGATIPVNTQLMEVDTAKERVDDLGTVRGIHPIASLSSSLAFYTVPLLLIDPAVGVPVWGAKSLVAPSANPEIYFPAGTELILRLTTAVKIPADAVGLPAIQPFSPAEVANIDRLLENSARQAYMGRRPSDVVNLILLGSRKQMDRAFHASGWLQAQRKSPLSLYRMYHALTKRHGYARAPMNALTLNGIPSAFVQQKSLDTVQKRHHVRWWQYPQHTDIWLGAAAEDVGFRFKLTHWTHSTDPHIDSERGKVVNDLAFTGCVAAAGLLPRPPILVPQGLKVEHPAVTDGQVVALRLNECIEPKLMAGAADIGSGRRAGRLAGALTAFRDDLVRSNIVFTVYNTVKLMTRHKTKPTMAGAAPMNIGRGRLDWLPAIAQTERGSEDSRQFTEVQKP